MKRLALLFLLLTTTFGVLQAQTKHYVKAGNPVNGNGLSWATASGNLQSIINGAAAGDSVFVTAGTYQPASGDYFRMKQGVKIYGGFVGGESNLAARDLAGGYTSILHGNGTSVIRNDDNSLDTSAVLDGFTITAGDAMAMSNGRDGGGIYNNKASPAFNNLTINGNSAFNAGGGIFNEMSSPVLTNVTISNNQARLGGGVFNNNSSSPRMTGVTISGNTASFSGGGVYNDVSSSPVLTGATITENTATNYGGGTYTDNGSSPVFTNTTISNNTSGQVGGGMLNQRSSVTLTNAVISGNTASGSGGGIYNNLNLSVTLTNVTIAANNATNSGGGIYNSGVSPLTLLNSIIFGNSNGITGAVSSMKYSLVQGLSNKLNGNIDATGLNATDIFTNFAGGNYALNISSRAINRGTPDTTGLNLPLTDVAGNPRIQKGTIDMGAYESPYDVVIIPDAAGIVYVTITGAGNLCGDSWANAAADIQRAINATGAAQVWAAGGTYQPASGQFFAMASGVKIYGGFAGTEASLAERSLTNGDTSILKGNGTSVIRNENNGLDTSAVLDGFMITGGNADGTGEGGNGGGIYNNLVSPAFSHLTITGNTASYGGNGMANVESSPVLDHVIIRGNETEGTHGGGMYNNYSFPVLTHVIISGNKSYDGGGMYNEYYSCPVLTNVLISNNTAIGHGGGMENNQISNPVLTNVTISGNTANVNTFGSGGGIYNLNSAVPELTNCILWGNDAGGEANEVNNSYGSSTTLHYSLYADGANDIAGGNLDADNSITDAPLFADAAGGNYQLLGFSPGLNKGNNGVISAGDSTDLAGNSRIYDLAGGGTVDLGAYEYQGNPVAPDANGILYTDSAAASNGDGGSWATALTSFGDALMAAGTLNAAATTPADSVRQIWVAKGTYQPAAEQSFEMVPKVKIYGGFAGNEGSLAERNLANGDTSILKGNGSTVIRNRSNGLDTTAVLDGFKITGGYKPITSAQPGGIFNYGVSPTYSNLIISGNAGSDGGGMYNNFGSAPVLTNVIISDNIGALGGGMYNAQSFPVMINVTISGNKASSLGGGILNNVASSPVLINSIIWGNVAGNGGAMKSMLQADAARIPGNEICNDLGSTMTLRNTLYGNGPEDVFEDTDNSITATDTLTADPLFVDAAKGDYRLAAGSPAINAGDNTALSANDTLDLAGNPRIFGTAIDMGAYENQDPVALPVTIQHFTGMLQSGVASLQWQSGAESNADHYTMEKSTDGKAYKPVATLRAKGSNSSYTCSAPQQEASAMYRLKWTDDNGHSAYYNQIVLLTQGGAATGMLVYPNPAKDYIHIRVAAAGSVSIYDVAGRLVKTQALSAGVNNMDIHRLVAGVYYAVVNGQQIQFVKH